MPKQVIGNTVRPPTGWQFVAGELRPEHPDAFVTAVTFDALYAWAKAKGYGLEPNWDKHVYSPDGVVVFPFYKVWTESFEKTKQWLGDGTWTNGTNTYSLGEVAITRGGVTYWNQCSYCMRGGIATWMVGRDGYKKRLCSSCSKPCKTVGCTEHVSTVNSTAKQIFDKCWTCAPRERCDFCGVWHPLSNVEEISGKKDSNHACKECAAQHRCAACGVVSRQVLRELDRKMLCGDCYGKEIEKERVKHEKFDAAELPRGGSVRLESFPNRPIRILSVETEVNGDGIAIANTLYNCGIVREPRVESYGTNVPEQSHYPAFLKHDGSVTGGELIQFLMQLDKKEHVDSFLNVMGKMRSLEKVGKVEYSHNCGGHIHIDAHNFDTNNVWRLITAYNYLEDVIFRLAGAGDKRGHRTLVPGHDRANGGRGYSHPTQKGPWGIQSNAYRALAAQDRMTGLNFQPYIRAAQYCECGCGADRLRSCKCRLPKCTIEWRVWNSTGNPRILHAWFAFMESLHAWADTPKEMTPDEEKNLPPFGWVKRSWADTSTSHKDTAFQRVRWIFENLVFSENEKDSLLYAFSLSDIQFAPGFLDEMRAIPVPKNRNVPAPRNCYVRGEIKVAPPRKKEYGVPPTRPRLRAAERLYNAMPPRRRGAQYR